MDDFKYRTVIPDVEFWKQMVPCQAACPVKTDAGRYVQLIAQGKYREAFLVARSPNPLASICGRVCAAPCEDRCRRGVIDEPISIRALKRFVTEKYGVESMEPDTQNELFENGTEAGNKIRWHLPILETSARVAERREKVAVIGAGPAGLGAAHDLALMGYQVTIFEATTQSGGMMFHGIPEFRLPRQIIEKEVETIKRLGVEIKYGTPLTADFGVHELREAGFAAIFISVGVQKGRDLAIEGSELDGVIKAVDYLININNGYRVDLGRKVLVIGGGFVAFDAARIALRAGLEGSPGASNGNSPVGDVHAAFDVARTAIRAGATEVQVASLESFEEMPVMRTKQGEEEFEEARKEGIIFRPQRSAKRFVGENGRLKSVDMIGVSRVFDDAGRFNPQMDESIGESMDVDSVILAIGQQADLSFLKPGDKVELTPGGTIRIDPVTLATSSPGLFAGGDVAFGPRILIDAVANGKQAALSIDDFLRGRTGSTTFHLSIEKIPTYAYRMPEDYEKLDRKSPPTVSLDRRTGISEVESGYDETTARLQAERCLSCHIQTVYDPQKCILCNRCVDVCPESCLKLVPLAELDLSPEQKEAAAAVGGFAEGTPLSAMLKDDEDCIRCGLCAARCPTDAMTMEVFYYEERETVR
ncbi:MAG TPA: FAD-dependent oxidoreductase [Pyrinomonadaceae bacterium]|jgi:NADPH-dependent glutamate synthase beta subunit-like oxidoreductase|nr:FAD-dependent oxidoreductase [Pyrinomonadaceae bacterium]